MTPFLASVWKALLIYRQQDSIMSQEKSQKKIAILPAKNATSNNQYSRSTALIIQFGTPTLAKHTQVMKSWSHASMSPSTCVRRMHADTARRWKGASVYDEQKHICLQGLGTSTLLQNQ